MNKIIKLFPILLLLLFMRCATTPPSSVMISPHYNATQIQHVALIGFTDYPGMIGSGEITASIFEKYLFLTGYRLVERRQVSEILKEQAFQTSGTLNKATLQKLGHILGVNALVFGSIDDFNNPREQTVMVSIPQQHSSPIYGQVETIHKNGDTIVKTTQNVVTGYNYSYSSQMVPQEQTVPAHVGISVRLVDVETGEVLWSASGSGNGSFLNEATENASSQVMEAIKKQLSKSP